MLCWSEKLSRIKNESSNLAGSLLFICDLYCKKNESKIEVNNNNNALFRNLAIISNTNNMALKSEESMQLYGWFEPLLLLRPNC